MNLDLSGVSVMVCMPAHRDIPVPTVVSLLGTADLMKSRGIPFEIQLQYGSSLVEVARTKGVDHFLKGDKNRLFWIDSDMSWSAAAFLRLLALSTKMDVVGAAYPYKQDPIQFPISPVNGTMEANEYGCIPMAGFGLGFTVMTRRVIQAVSDMSPKLKFPGDPEPIPHVFRCDTINGEFRGEDMAFFADIRSLGYEVCLDPTVTLGHVGQKTYEATFIDNLERA
jgi:hypothetical protein